MVLYTVPLVLCVCLKNFSGPILAYIFDWKTEGNHSPSKLCDQCLE